MISSKCHKGVIWGRQIENPGELEFPGSREDQCIQVGNAFPPLLAELIANNICKAVSGNWLPGTTPALAAYSLLEMDDRLPFPLEA